MSKTAKTIFLVRHTPVALSAAHCYGQLDVELAPHAEESIAEVLKRLPPLDAVWTSSLQRCYVLAERILPLPQVFEDLQEYNFGAWEGKKWSEIPEDALNAWMQDFVKTAPPQGESYEALQERTIKAFGKIEQAMQAGNLQNIGIVTHGGNMRALLAHVLHIPLAQSFQLEIGFGAICRLRSSHSGYKLVLD